MDHIEIPSNLLEKLRNAKHVAVLTGAGISAESKIPTFRDAQTGLWARYRPEELATPEAFIANPKLVWDWYQWRRTLVSDARPNPGHEALVAMQDHFPQFTLITQNVDSLHQRAGSRDVVELHGNISRIKCFNGCGVIEEWEDSEKTPPECPKCGGMLRPDVVWFGEALPEEAMLKAADAAVNSDVFFSIGTSALVYPAAGYVIQASRHGAFTVEVNIQVTAQSRELSCVIEGPSGRVLPKLLEQL